MIDTDNYTHTVRGLKILYTHTEMAEAVLLLATEVKRLQKENKILAKYMDIVQKYDDALLADGDTDPRWSELYD